MAAEVLILAVFALLALAAAWDIASFTIPNFIPLSLIVLFACFVVAARLSWDAIGSHVLVGFIGLIAGFVLFALRFIGGGDAKLFAATLVWLGFRDALDYALIAALFGGGLTLAILSVRALPLPVFLVRHAWLARLHDQKAGIPYGVALASGAFAVLPYTEVFRIATAL